MGHLQLAAIGLCSGLLWGLLAYRIPAPSALRFLVVWAGAIATAGLLDWLLH